MLRGLKAIVFMLVLAVLFNLFLSPGGTELLRFGFLKITDSGLVNAFSMLMRLVLLVICSSLMTLTTTPNELTDGMERLFMPLTKLHVPVHEIALMMSIALRFIPILLEETDRIMKAQQARGAEFDRGNVFKRIKAMVPILVPLFVSAFRRASDLAMAMEARGYQGGKARTKMKPLRYKGRDLVAYLCMVVFLAGIVVVKVLL
jgi:energy-coupling factor transport system permease protein